MEYKNLSKHFATLNKSENIFTAVDSENNFLINCVAESLSKLAKEELEWSLLLKIRYIKPVLERHKLLRNNLWDTTFRNLLLCYDSFFYLCLLFDVDEREKIQIGNIDLLGFTNKSNDLEEIISNSFTLSHFFSSNSLRNYFTFLTRFFIRKDCSYKNVLTGDVDHYFRVTSFLLQKVLFEKGIHLLSKYSFSSLNLNLDDLRDIKHLYYLLKTLSSTYDIAELFMEVTGVTNYISESKQDNEEYYHDCVLLLYDLPSDTSFSTTYLLHLFKTVTRNNKTFLCNHLFLIEEEQERIKERKNRLLRRMLENKLLKDTLVEKMKNLSILTIKKIETQKEELFGALKRDN